MESYKDDDSASDVESEQGASASIENQDLTLQADILHHCLLELMEMPQNDNPTWDAVDTCKDPEMSMAAVAEIIYGCTNKELAELCKSTDIISRATGQQPAPIDDLDLVYYNDALKDDEESTAAFPKPSNITLIPRCPRHPTRNSKHKRIRRHISLPVIKESETAVEKPNSTEKTSMIRDIRFPLRSFTELVVIFLVVNVCILLKIFVFDEKYVYEDFL